MSNSYISISKNRLFVWSFIVVLSLAIILHIMYFEKFSRHVLKNDRSAKIFHMIQKEGERIEVSAIGTSHTSASLRMDADYFFNYARSGTWHPEVAYAKVSHLLQYATNLKVLFLEVDHISILGYDHLLHSTDPDQYLYLLKHVSESLYDEEKITAYDNKTTFIFSLQADVAPVIHRKYFQSYLLGRGKKKEPVSLWTKLTSKEKMVSAKKRVRSYRINTSSKIDQSVSDYYEKAIDKAREHGVKVYLLFLPQTKEYLSEINEENNIRVYDFVFDLAKRDHVKVLDYRHYFALDESLFLNQDHVNKKGSEVLTQEVMKVIQNDL